jgi:hypothetical protein
MGYFWNFFWEDLSLAIKLFKNKIEICIFLAWLNILNNIEKID